MTPKLAPLRFSKYIHQYPIFLQSLEPMKTSILCYQIALGEINSCYFKLQVPSIERVIDLGHSLILIIGSGYQSFYKNEFYPTPRNIE